MSRIRTTLPIAAVALLALPLAMTACPPTTDTDPTDAVSPTPTSAGTTAEVSPSPTPTAVPTPTPGTTLPLAVTNHYFLSGYFSEWGGGDEWIVAYESETPGTCPLTPGGGLGDCLSVTYNRDPDGDGAGPNFSGWYWQYPADNWGQDDDGDGQPDLGPGFDIPDGATQVSFWAWGAAGGERVNFKAGINAADGFEIASGTLDLTTTPTQYTIDVSGSGYTEVTGGFAMIMEWQEAPIGSAWTWYLDGIVWE